MQECKRHKSQCPARVTTYEGSVQSSRGEHNHPPDLVANEVEATISNMKKRAGRNDYSIPQINDKHNFTGTTKSPTK